MNPLVSIIIPTKNSARTLDACLASCKEQDYDATEIIVVDNFSHDGTQEIARKYTDKVYEKGPERSAQKNYGISQAKGEYLLLIDSDMLIDKELITDCVELCTKKRETSNDAGVCVPVVDFGNSWWVKVIAFERSLYIGTQMEAARFLRKDVVEQVGGFDEKVVFMEEFLVPQKIADLGYNVKFHTHYNLYHDYWDFSLWSYLSKKFYYGKSALDYKNSQSLHAVSQISPLQRYWLFFKNSKFWSNPLYGGALIILKTLEYIFGGLGLLYSKLV